MRNCAIVIPALNPSDSLIDYIGSLLLDGAAQVIVVNDGSDDVFTPIFNKINELEKCTVLTHNVNRGKGRALKTAFHFYLTHFSELSGVVTADSDGQHTIEDVAKVADALEINHGKLILGVRDFRKENVPFRSHLGNRATTLLFRWLFDYTLKDTQTGLRGISTNEIPSFLNLKGERYEYEINMLIHARKIKIDFIELPINTIYFNNNEGSHYKSFRDSLKIFTKMIGGSFRYSKITKQISKPSE